MSPEAVSGVWDALFLSGHVGALTLGLQVYPLLEIRAGELDGVGVIL